MQPLSNPSTGTVHLFPRGGDRIAVIIAARETTEAKRRRDLWLWFQANECNHQRESMASPKSEPWMHKGQ